MSDPRLDRRLDELARMAKHPSFVADNVRKMRAPLKAKTVFTAAGKTVVHSPGERIIYGPDNTPLCKVIEDELGGCQIEEDERLHAVVRPPTITKGTSIHS